MLDRLSCPFVSVPEIKPHAPLQSLPLRAGKKACQAVALRLSSSPLQLQDKFVGLPNTC